MEFNVFDFWLQPSKRLWLWEAPSAFVFGVSRRCGIQFLFFFCVSFLRFSFISAQLPCIESGNDNVLKDSDGKLFKFIIKLLSSSFGIDVRCVCDDFSLGVCLARNWLDFVPLALRWRSSLLLYLNSRRFWYFSFRFLSFSFVGIEHSSMRLYGISEETQSFRRQNSWDSINNHQFNFCSGKFDSQQQRHRVFMLLRVGGCKTGMRWAGTEHLRRWIISQ